VFINARFNEVRWRAMTELTASAVFWARGNR
jgi:hypothetical protein